MRTTIFRRLQRACLLIGGLALAAAAQAHHSAAQFDFTQNVEITGKIIHIDVSNPHIDLILEQPAEGGGTKQVQYEGHSRNNVFRRGWRPDMMKDGDTVTIFIAPMRNGEDGGYIQSFKLADGRTF